MAINERALFALFLCLLPLSIVASIVGPVSWLIDAPNEVVAGTLTAATILPLNLYNGDPKYVSSYSIYLIAAATSGQLGFGADFVNEQCFLAQNISVCDPTITIASDHVSFENTTIQFTIPPSVGPDGANYGVSIRLFQTDGSSYSVDFTSNIFNLSSATGNWSHYQLADWVLSSADTTPCTSLACVKNCSDMVWNGTFLLSSGESSNGTVFRNCAEKCHGVTIPLAQNEAPASSSTSLGPSLITSTYGSGDDTSSLTSRTAPVCPATTTLQSVQASETGSSSLPTSTSTSTGAATGPTKSSAATYSIDRAALAWKSIAVCILLGWAVL